MTADQMQGTGLSVAPVSRAFEQDMTDITNFQPPHNPLDIIKGPLKSFDVITEAMKRFVREDGFDQIIILMTTMYLQKIAPKLMLDGLKEGPEKTYPGMLAGRESSQGTEPGDERRRHCHL